MSYLEGFLFILYVSRLYVLGKLSKNVGSNMSFFQKGEGGVSTKPKVLRHFLFALKQSKANKCQCAKRLKTVKKFFLKFLLNNFGKSEKSASKIPKVRGGVPTDPKVLRHFFFALKQSKAKKCQCSKRLKK